MTEPDPFDPDRWDVAGDLPQVDVARPRARSKRRRGKFLKGPVPWPWLQAAMKLPGKALAVGLMLWLESGITGRRTVRFCLRRAVEQGVPESTARRAVRELEAAGLVSVQRKPGRGLEVTLVDDPD